LKVAVLADIHASLPALVAVSGAIERWRPDEVIVAGDIVNRGPRPAECLDFVQERVERAGWRALRGNHEDYVLIHTRPETPRSGPLFEVYRNSYWTFCRLNGRVEGLERLPFAISLTDPAGGELRAVHASMRGNRDGIFPDTPDAVLRRQIDPAPAALVVGHTHRPLVRCLDDTLVVNAGAVGMPFDGDWRAAYAQLTWSAGRWQAEIIRLAYDREQAERDFVATGFLSEAGALAQIMLAELRQSRSLLDRWVRGWEPAFLAGEMTIAESVRDFLAHYGLSPEPA
jgi:predicted phosphodiesterase